jgi:hypothetical protein
MSPRHAILCAIGLQRTLAGEAAGRPEQPMRTRIGLHATAFVPRDGDRFRETHALTAHIASLARGGEILVSSALKDVAGIGDDLSFGPARALEIEAPDGPCTVYEVHWAGMAPTPGRPRGTFRHDGGYWSIAWRGRGCLVKDLRGFHYIARLLQHPGREFHALDLISACGSARAHEHASVPILDAPVRASYARRLEEIRDDLEEAERLCDAGRTAHARAERDVLAEQLALAMGLGGRDRLVAAAVERARSTVTQAIRLALKRIHCALPALAEELKLRIRTGVFCLYVPDRVSPIDWTS